MTKMIGFYPVAGNAEAIYKIRVFLCLFQPSGKDRLLIDMNLTSGRVEVIRNDTDLIYKTYFFSGDVFRRCAFRVDLRDVEGA